MARRRKILLHIGLPKTGTTAFQKICKGNPEALLLQRTRFYNSIWRGGTAAEELTLSVMRPGLECFASSKLGNVALADIRQRTRDGIGHLLQHPKADRFLLSDENLCFLRSKDELQRLRSLFPQDVDFEIYLMLRERRDWARSLFGADHEHCRAQTVNQPGLGLPCCAGQLDLRFRGDRARLARSFRECLYPAL